MSAIKKIISASLAAVFVLALASCSYSDKPEKLPPVTTTELPDNESLMSSLNKDGLKINIYETYAEIAEYDGEASELVIDDAYMGFNVKKIAEYAFFGNEHLEKVTLPSELLMIDISAFQECTKLREVVAGDKLEIIESSAFRDTPLQKINLPDTVSVIERYAFYRTKLEELTLPSSLSTVGKYAFYGCEELKSVKLCPRLERLGEYAFGSCRSLEEIVITPRVVSLGDYCFTTCTSLKKIFIPKNAELGENVFLGCSALTVYSPKGSKAESAASKYGYAFKACSAADKMS